MSTQKTSIADRAKMSLTKPHTAPTPVESTPTQEAPAAAAAPAARPAAAAQAAPRTKDIRLSVGLVPKLYHYLVGFTNELAMRLGLPRVPHVQVIRALLEELQENKGLQETIAQRVTGEYR